MTYYMTALMYANIVAKGAGTLDKAGVIAYINSTFGFKEPVTDIKITR